MHRILGFFSFLIVLVMLCSSCCSGNVQHPLTTVDLAKIANDSTVALVFSVNKKVKPFCTGVWISEDVILTANHCIDGLAEVMNKVNEADDEDAPVVLPQGIMVPYIVQSEVVDPGKMPSAIHFSTAYLLSEKLDLALLKASPKSIPRHGIARLAVDTPEIGEHINITGHVQGLYWSYVSGYVSAYRDDMGEVGQEDISGPFIQISAPVSFGNSGGGAFNDSGELVGISSFIIPSTGAAFYIHLQTIKGWLQGQRLIPIVLDPLIADPIPPSK